MRGGGSELDDQTDQAELTEFGSETETETEAKAPIPDEAPAPTPFVQRARAVKALLDRLKDVDAGEAAPLLTRYATALGHAQAGRQPQALELLQEVEDQTNHALRSPGTTQREGDEEGEEDEEAAKRASWRGDALSVGKLLNAALAQGRADAAELKAMFARSSALARPGGDIDRAAEILADLAVSLEGATPPAARDDAPPAAAKGPSLVVLQQSRLVWDAARKKTIADVGKLSNAITAFCKTPEDAAIGANAVKNLEVILANFDEALSDTLDEALNAADPEFRARKHHEAAAHIARYQTFIAQNPIIHTMDENPIVPVSIHATMSNALSVLASKLKV